MLHADELQLLPRSDLVSRAATMGINKPTAMSKAELVQEILLMGAELKPKPITHSESNPSDVRLRDVPPASNATQADIMEVCQGYIDSGVITVTFPAEDQFYMRNTVTGQEDSGNIRQPLRNFVRIAKTISGDKT